jgi:hypothetical protein
LSSPTDLRFGPDGNLYVANLGGNSVAVFNAQTGQPVNTPQGNGVFATGGNLSSPTTLAFGPDGGLYVGNLGNSEVVRYSLSDGSHSSVFASGGGLDGVGGIAFGPNGNLFVSSLTPDYPNNVSPPKVVQFNGTSGALIGDFVKNTGTYSFPAGLQFLPNHGNLLVASAGLGNVLAFGPVLGAPLGTLTTGGSLFIAGQIVLTPVPGDATGDGYVDGADYTIWADDYGKHTTLGPAAGDFNHDGVVDGADYTIWADHYHQSVSSLGASTASPIGPASVPEPATISLAVMALAGLFFWQRRRGTVRAPR